MYTKNRLLVFSVFILGLVAGANYADAADKMCTANFGQGDCGTLTVRDGKAIFYRSGKCGGATRYSHGAIDGGAVIRVQQATISNLKRTNSSISGKWRLGSFVKQITFNCK